VTTNPDTPGFIRPDVPTGTVDDFLPDFEASPVPTAKPKARQKVTPLRPVAALAAEIEEPPVAAEPDPDAKPKAGRKPKPDAPPPPDEDPGPPPGRDDGPAPPRGRSARPKGEIWDGCPVKPLGVNGGHCYYLDALGQLRAIGKHERQTIAQLFAHRLPTLFHHFAKVTVDKDTGAVRRKPDDFEADKAAFAMMAACGELGLFDPEGAIRGVGAWVDDDGSLIYHAGDVLITPEGEREPATHHGRIYPAYPPIPKPALTIKDGAAPGAQILETLSTWNWQRDIDAQVMLGVIGTQMLGGALDWRPTVWITGGKASGKSTLQNLIKHVHGGEKGLVQSNDATKSGLTSRIGHGSLPVALDELEPGDERSSKEKDIITLARVASSGGQWFRGSSDQKGAGGNVYSTFFFSSILIPGELKPQDLSRLIILSLSALPEGATAPTLRADVWRGKGAALKRVLIDRWSTWAKRLELWREAFAAEGIAGRNGDNWATVLAMADMALNEGQPTAETLTSWSRRVAKLIRAEVAELGSDADGMLMHLLTQKYDIYRRGEQHTIAQWLMAAARLPGYNQTLLGDAWTDQDDYAKAVNAKLATAGLRVYGSGQEAKLFIANNPIQGLLDLFAKSEWAKTVWKQSAARVPGATASPDPLTLAGIRSRGWHIPFTSIPGLMSFPMDRDKSPDPSTPPPIEASDFA
jgi:hypothetical protein